MAEQVKSVTVEHLTNSLAQIELWITAVRQALSALDPKLEIALREGEYWEGEHAPIRTTRNCPPPE
jgi:hypothetical protein